MNNIVLLIICIAVPLIVGGISSAFIASAVKGWYATAKKSRFTPPNYIFGPAWMALYVLMGISLYMVLKDSGEGIFSLPVLVFAIQLTLNFFWSLIFFYWKSPGAALIDLVIMWLAIIAMIIVFYPINLIAALLQLPYLCWVSFAAIPNGAFWRLNRR